MSPNVKVVLFEDTLETKTKILVSLERQLASEGSVVPFAPGLFEEPEANKDRMYEERLESILNQPPYAGATFVVADRDLSKSKDVDFRGLSVSDVAAACKTMAIPIGAYARQPRMGNGYDWRGRWDQGHITFSLSEGEEELARKAAIAARGFADIAARLPEVKVRGKKSPARVLAVLLGKPEYADKIALYAVGDRNQLTEIPDEIRPQQEGVQKMSTFLGYWLWDSLLRYPGLLVNEVAAASYLNIDTDSFCRREVQSIFETALYQGPFADPQAPQWWRGMLDDIVAMEKCADGLELVHRRVDKQIERSRCREDPSRQAGYYCIISREPVCLEHSKGGLSWFPRGADLTRISNSKFEEYEPWLGG